LERELKSKAAQNVEILEDNIEKSFMFEKSINDFTNQVSKDKFDVFNFDLNYNYSLNKVEFNEDELKSDPDQEQLFQLYQRNLLRYEIIKRLNKELVYARSMLEKAMKTQNNIVEIRKRVDWLENEIEKILLSNKNVLVQFVCFFI
jgi:hypothetical protein